MTNEIPAHHLAQILDKIHNGNAKCIAKIRNQNGKTFLLDLTVTDVEIFIDQDNSSDKSAEPNSSTAVYGTFPNEEPITIIDNQEINFQCQFSYKQDEDVVYLNFKNKTEIKTNGVKVRNGG